MATGEEACAKLEASSAQVNQLEQDLAQAKKLLEGEEEARLPARSRALTLTQPRIRLGLRRTSHNGSTSTPRPSTST